MEKPITLIVNGFEEKFPENTRIADLIVHFKEGDQDLIVEHNGRFVYPDRYDKIILSEMDQIEFINPNFGG